MAVSDNLPAFNPDALASKISAPIKDQIAKTNKERDETLKLLAEEFLRQIRSKNSIALEDKSTKGNSKIIEGDFERLANKILPKEYLKDIAKETTQRKIVEENKKIASGIAKLKDLSSNIKSLYREFVNSNKNKNIEKLTKELHDSLRPIKAVAREDTLKKVENTLNQQHKTDDGWFQSVDDRLVDVEKNTSLLSKIKDGILKLYESSQRRLGLAVVTDKKMEKMQRMVDFSRKLERTQHLREQVSGIKTSDKALFYLSELGNVIVPEDTIMRKVVDGVASTAAFFGGLGAFMGNAAWKAGSSLMNSLPKTLGSISGIFTPFITLSKVASKFSLRGILSGPTLASALGNASKFLLTSTTFMGGIAALATSAVFLSLAKSPELIGKYGEAFSRIWTDNILPAFEWLGSIGERLMAFWKSDGEASLTKIGDFINNSLIYVLGTFIPETLTFIGKTIADGVETVIAIGTDITSLIINWGAAIQDNFYSLIGMFGFGPKGDKGFLSNLTDIITNNVAIFDQLLTTLTNTVGNVVSFLYNLFDNALTGIYNMIFGKSSDETILTQFGEWLDKSWNGIVASVNGFISGLWTSFENAWDNVVKNVNDFVWGSIEDTIAWVKSLNPFDTIKTKINDMINAITGIFPSFEDIENYLRSFVKDNEWIPEWLKNKILDGTAPHDLSQDASNAMATTNIPNSTTTSIIQFNTAPSPARAAATPVPPSGPRTARGRPSTKPDLSGHDQKLYGVSGFGTSGGW